MIDYGFLTQLVAAKVREASSHGRTVWHLRQDLAFNSPTYGLIIVPAGFESDFASVPRLPVVWWLTGGTADASAVVHDYLVHVHYPLGKCTWKQAADIFAEAMKFEGVPSWRRWLMRQGVLGADPRKSWEQT